MKRKYLFKSRKKLQQLSCVHKTRHKLFWKYLAKTVDGNPLAKAVTNDYLLTQYVFKSWKQQLKLWKQKK